MKTFRVKNFERFQHYKDRAPPWIKLYNELLENYEFCLLPDVAKGQLICIWLLASRSNNKVPFDAVWIARKIGATEPVDLNVMLEAGFIEHDDGGKAFGKVEAWPSRHIPDSIKNAVSKRDGGKCQRCGSKKTIEYDHVIPVSRGGESVEENLQLLCRPCNRRKRSTMPAEQLATQTCAAAYPREREEAEEEAEAER